MGQVRDAYIVTRTGLKDLGVSVALASRKNSQADGTEGTINVQMSLFTKQRQTQTEENKLKVAVGERVGGRDSYRVWDRHVYTAASKMDNQQGPTV